MRVYRSERPNKEVPHDTERPNERHAGALRRGVQQDRGGEDPGLQRGQGEGHDRGDTYLKAACRLICRIFQHSPVFRIGGDEFAVILRNSDFENRQQLVNEFEASVKANNASVNNRWEEINIAMGIAVYDPDLDQSALDVVRRADGIMYSNKRNQKEQNA